MSVYKFTWDEEFGIDDWRELEWSCKANNSKEAWMKFYDHYGILDNYVDWYYDHIEDSLTEKQIINKTTLTELEKHLLWMISNEWSKYQFCDLKMKLLGE